MAAYRNIYQFSIVSQNGDDVDIFISKKNYAGVVQQRSLGRAPILKRERNGNILGTSLEIYAECKVDGEFSQLYTSSADEFLVEVYRSRVLLWTGFVSPELYSEPDIAPPYDVQIIATDGLGELKNYDFVQGGNPRSFLGHLNAMLAHTSLDLGVEAVSSLEYYDDGWSGNTGMMSVVTDMSHREGEDCYEVMQSMLSSVNAVITQQEGKWMVIRESDMHVLAGDLGPVAFGAMTDNSWWPVGNLSTDIIPAKKSLALISENHYKATVLDNSQMNGDAAWTKEFNALYDAEESAYRLPVSGSAIRQKASFYAEVGYRLLLHISARNIGSMEEPQMLGVIIKIDGRMYQAGSEFWLGKRVGYEDKYLWSNTEKSIEVELPASSESDTRSDAQDIDIVIPLYKYDNRSYAYATAVEVSLYNVSGDAAIAVYGCSLSQYDRSAGNKIAVAIGNDAREDAGEIDFAFSDGEYALAAADVFRNAIPLGYDSSAIIKKWRTPAAGEGAYLSVMASDYAMQVALPRMRYRGKLNVPSMAHPVIPMIFERDSTYYFLNTYSYDLLNDELEVELVSIPNASVIIESETVTELPSVGSASGSSSGSGSSGGGGGSSTLAGLSDVQVGDAQNGQALVYENGYWVPRTVSGGGALTSDAIIAALGYTPLNADLFTKANLGLGNVDNIAANKYFTALSSGTTNAVSMTIGGVTKSITAATLKTSLGLAGLAYQTSVQAALGYTPFDSDAFTKANIKNALGIADWALAANKPSYTWTEIGSRPTALSAFTNDLGLGSLAYKNSLAASDIPSLPWSKITSGKPTTLSGYGITDAYTKTNADAKFLQQAGGTITGDMIVNTKLTSTVIEALQYFADGKLIMHRKAGAENFFLNYGGAAERLYAYASTYGFHIGASRERAFTIDSNKDANFAANLTVVGDMYSKNYPGGKALSQDPTSAFISTIFDADAVNDSSYRMKILRSGSAYDRFVAAYSPAVAFKTGDTHGFISFGYNAAGKAHCYIGGGSADKINWSGKLFHDNMDLIPKDDGVFYLGNSGKRWGTLNVVNVYADGIYGYVPEGGTYQRYRLLSSGDRMYLQVGAQDGTATTGKLTICGINIATLLDLAIYSQQTSFSGAVQVNGTSQFVSLATFDKGIKIGDATLTWDASAGMLKIDKGVYSEGAITAKKKA